MLRWMTLLGFLIGCGDKEECTQDADCADGQECVVDHDHEGDDHSHGGTCTDVDPEEDSSSDTGA